LFAVYGLGRLLGGRLVGLWGALALLSMPGFWIMARVARPDLTLVVLIMFSCLFLGWAMRLPNRMGKAGWLVASGVASALAVITKGPYGLLVPLLFLTFAPRSNPALVRPRWRLLWFGLGMVLMLAAWSWPVHLRDGGQYLRGVIFQKYLSTPAGSGYYRSLSYYLGPGFLRSLPAILFLPLAIRQWRREKQFPAALAIAVVFLLVISCVPRKRPHYLLPLLPFLALGLASGIASLAQHRRLLRRLAIVAIVGGIAAGPVYYGPILHWLNPHGDPEAGFITEVARTLPPNATAVCFGAMHESLARVRHDHRRVIGVSNLAGAKAALQAGDGDCYLVASERDLLALKEAAVIKSFRPVIEHDIPHQGRWLLAQLGQ
jgi:4-amino-4-deoxy-L-arabinose transferase-like glycosyltransferase